jgi:hypothetical protein
MWLILMKLIMVIMSVDLPILVHFNSDMKSNSMITPVTVVVKRITLMLHIGGVSCLKLGH